jgi:hypothetical protein
MAHFKTPRGVTFVAELPKTATGKIQKFVLRGGAANLSRQLSAAVIGARWQKPPSYRAPKTALSPGGTTPRTPRCPPPADGRWLPTSARRQNRRGL